MKNFAVLTSHSPGKAARSGGEIAKRQSTASTRLSLRHSSRQLNCSMIWYLLNYNILIWYRNDRIWCCKLYYIFVVCTRGELYTNIFQYIKEECNTTWRFIHVDFVLVVIFMGTLPCCILFSSVFFKMILPTTPLSFCTVAGGFDRPWRTLGNTWLGSDHLNAYLSTALGGRPAVREKRLLPSFLSCTKSELT